MQYHSPESSTDSPKENSTNSSDTANVAYSGCSDLCELSYPDRDAIVLKVIGDENNPIQADPYEHLVSNKNSNLDHIYVNGVGTDDEALTIQQNYATKIAGQATFVGLNPRSGSLVRDLWNATLGFLSPELGKRAEPEVVHSLMERIKTGIAEGRELNIAVHSHGAIVTSNALFLLKKELSAPEWKEVKDGVKITAMGAGISIWPIGVQVRSFAHEEDPVAKLTHTLGRLRGVFSSFGFFNEGRSVSPTEIEATDWSSIHGIRGYEANFHLFLIEEYKNDGMALAVSLVQDIQEGAFADRIFNNVIREMIAREDIEFAKALVELDDAGVMKNYELGDFRPALHAIICDMS